MNNTPIVVFINRGFSEIRPSLLLAPEVAASFGWSNGSVISTAEAAQAIVANKAHAIARFEADREAAEAMLQAARAILTAGQWKEFIFLALCEHNDQQTAEVDKWSNAINVLDNIAKGGRK